MFRKLQIAAAFLLLSAAAHAQNYTAPTPPFGDDSNRIATTAFVQDAIAGSMTPLPDGEIFVGDVSGVAAAVPMSGDCGIVNTGAVTCTKINGVSFPASPSTNRVPVVTSSNTVTWQLVTNDQVSASAAIAYSKLNLVNSIVNADIASGAAIAYSKLNLTGSIVNADISGSANIDASKLSFTQSGTGAVAQTVQAKLRQAINIMDFGAVGNGIANDTTALNNFLAACQASTYRLCYIPSGSYNITSQPTSITTNITLVGDGLNTILRRNYNGAGNTGLFDIQPTAGGTEIKSLTIWGISGTTGGSLISGVSDAVTSLGQLVFEDLYLTTTGTDTHNYAIYLDGSLKTTGTIGVRGVDFRNVRAFGAATASVYLRSVINANWFGGGQATAGGTSTTGFVVTGVSGAASQYVNLYPDVNNGCFDLDRVSDLFIFTPAMGACGGVSIKNTANTSNAYYASPSISGSVQSNWSGSGRIQPAGGGTGDVTGPGSATDNAIARFDGTSGKFIQNSAVTVADTTGVISGTQGINLAGSSSGAVTIQPQAAAGTYNFNLPTSAGTAGQPLLSGGGGATAQTYGTLGAPAGGTGQSSYTIGDLLYASSTTALSKLSAVATGSIMASAGTGTAPAYTTTPTLGASGTLGSLTLGNATSGLVTLQTVTGALGTRNISFPAATGTVLLTTTIAAPQVTVYTSGSGTYNVPAGALYLTVEVQGGGGGGAGSGTTPGAATAGGNSTFGTAFLTANGGSAGSTSSNTTVAGGTATGGDVNMTGGTGASGTSSTGNPGGSGGSSFFGGQGENNLAGGFAGIAATGYGSGGSGAGSNVNPNAGGGGGAGGYCRKLVTSPSSSYSYAVGAAGASGTAGTGGAAGGAGMSGIIIITAYFQ